jgi:hypothetical protein
MAELAWRFAYNLYGVVAVEMGTAKVAPGETGKAKVAPALKEQHAPSDFIFFTASKEQFVGAYRCVKSLSTEISLLKG